MKKKSAIISFYSGEGFDDQGRSFSEILKWDYDSLESTHDYIQWLFPLDVASAYNCNAPILAQEDIDTFLNSTELQHNVIKALLVMLEFYGFSLNAAGRIVRSDRFNERATNWINAGNHNLLRITRILKSLSMLGLNDYAKEFFSALQSVYADYPNIIRKSYGYWLNAIE
jgi:hypothetical protein